MLTLLTLAAALGAAQAADSSHANPTTGLHSMYHITLDTWPDYYQFDPNAMRGGLPWVGVGWGW